jgi:hypothetical protein
MREHPKFHRAVAALCALAISGCAGSGLMWPTSPPPAPASTAADPPAARVQDCINIGSGTPSKYVCHGKTYTSHELRKMREDAAAPSGSKS